MNVLVIGAHGAIGRMIIQKMSASAEFTPTAFIRKESQREVFDNNGTPIRIQSVEASVEDIAATMVDQDAIIFTAGSGSATGPDKTLTVDLDGAVKSMEAAAQMSVRRFVMISALRAGDRSIWETSPIKPYFVAKHYADRMLMSMDLNYTILRPGRLFDDPGTGKISIVNPMERRGVAREDVASLAIEVLNQKNTFGRVIEFNEGEDPIPDVVASL
ncbi:MAG: SDR family oxidoreductase [Bacteroidota bacterium]